MSMCYNKFMSDRITKAYCRQCHKPFIQRNSNRKFCTKVCQWASYGCANCKYCGELFSKMSPNAKYCSNKCRDEYYNPNIPWGVNRKRFFVLKRDGFRCQYCGDSPRKNETCVLHIDHVKPKSRGGSDGVFNLVTACERCNLGKSNLFDTTKEIDLSPPGVS